MEFLSSTTLSTLYADIGAVVSDTTDNLSTILVLVVGIALAFWAIKKIKGLFFGK